jgi:hypothetical protein
MKESEQFYAITIYPLGKEPRCPLVRRLNGPQSRSEPTVVTNVRAEKRIQSLHGIISRGTKRSPLLTAVQITAVS